MSELSAEIHAPADTANPEHLREQVIAVLRTVFDPEIPVNIYELGLVYDVSVSDTCEASIRMTLTTPMCPVAEELPLEVESKARSVAGVRSARVDLVWDPPWSMEMMSDAAKLELGML
jgi:FeS assembly SUF system protein